jgi:hypothetical protein
MKPFNVIVIFAYSILTTSCAYRGAVYSEYEQMALDIRASAASGSPVQVNFGYDQGVLAYVPKQNNDTNSTQGEAVSLISWNNIATELNPKKVSTNSVLRVDAGFISGVAADVVSAPPNIQVTIVAPNLTNTVSTSGSIGERIAAATTVFEPATIQVVDQGVQSRRVALAKALATFPADGTKANQVLAAAGFPTVPASQANDELQDRILAAQSDATVKILEDAFNKVK